VGQRLGNCGESSGDGADSPSVPSDLDASVESGIGGFCGGTTTVCGCCSLRADLTSFFDGLVASFFDGFSGKITRVASGNSSTDNLRSFGGFSDSTQQKRPLLAPQSQRTPQGQSSRTRSIRQAQPEHRRALGRLALQERFS
jgi:hypothetical protein